MIWVCDRCGSRVDFGPVPLDCARGACRRSEDAEREWEATLVIIGFMILACLWEAIGVWYR